MAYYRSLQNLKPPDAGRHDWAERRFWTAFAGIAGPFVVVLLIVAYCHFIPDVMKAGGVGDLMHFRFRMDSVAAAGLLVLLAAPFPSLFVVAAWQAWGNVPADPPGPFPGLAEEVRYNRSIRFLLDEGRWPLLFRRLGFALAIVLTADALIAQLFSYASGVFAEGRILRLVVMGAAGYYLYVLVAFSQRYFTGNLSQRMLASFYTRMAVVLLLTAALTVLNGGPQGFAFTAPAAFLAGIFPDSALQAVAKFTQTNLGRFAVDPASNFRRLPEISLWRETSLVELGINDLHDLANSPADDVIVDVGFIPAVFLQAVDRALLIDAFSPTQGSAPPAPGTDPLDRLAPLGVTSASDFVLYALGRDGYPPLVATDPPRDPARVEQLAPQLDAQQQQARQGALAHALNPADLAPVQGRLADLRFNRNLRYILTRRLAYGDA